jgi:hypothetical protein
MFRAPYPYLKSTQDNEVGGKPRILTPRTEPNLKSTTLYPAERVTGLRVNERKKGKEPVSKG